MRKVRANLLKLLGLIAVLVLVAVGCGGGGTSGKADLSGAEITVGSKEFTEQLVLGQIAILVLENAGATVEDQTRLAGSVAARQALESGEIDTYWDYTGTGWITYLGHTQPIDGSQKQYEAVAKEDLKKNDIKWLPPAPANNTYVLAVREEVYDDLGVKELSDFEQLIKENPEEASLCAATEFLNRDDGLPGLEEAYGFEFPSDQLVKIELGLIPEAVDQGERCNFGEVFATDARIEGLDLKVIEDDKSFFPVYNPALNVRKQVYEDYPEIEKIFAPVSEKLTTETLLNLNAQVDVEGQLPEDVAEQWLSENGFI
ncbi:MAG: glycine betaine ABC transporter substrate-binding protein [Actinobacteria bacterium]|nr:glycine betaine ABC transporter substrate-binding protein [Actinomycetota bacterium]